MKPPPNFRKSFDHQGLVLNSTIGALAHLQIGRAYAMQGDTAKSSCRLSRFPHALERRRSRHLHSEASQGGVRQAAVKPCSFVLFWFSAEAAVLLEAKGICPSAWRGLMDHPALDRRRSEFSFLFPLPDPREAGAKKERRMNVTMQPVDAINSANRHRFSFRNH